VYAVLPSWDGTLICLPVNDPESEYDYPERVRFELTEEELASYERAASSSISQMSIWSACA